MKSNEFQDLWIRYRQASAGDSEHSISEAETQQLSELVQRYPSLLAELTDDQVVDSMLCQMATQSADDAFVQNCMIAIQEDQAIPANPHPTEFATHDANVTLSSQDRITTRSSKTQSAERHKKRQRQQAIRAGILIGACAVILLPVLVAISWMPGNDNNSTAEVKDVKADDGTDSPNRDQQNESALDLATDALEKKREQPDAGEQRISPNPFREVPQVADNRQPDPIEDRPEDALVENKGVNSEIDPMPAKPTFVTVEFEEDSEWIKGPDDPRIADGFLTLDKGRANLKFDNGSDIELIGPAEIEVTSPDSIYVHRGHILANIPAGQSEFSIKTPSSRLTESQNSQLELNVDKTGASEVLIDRGMAKLYCWSSQLADDLINLNANDKNQAVVENIDLNSRTPAICMARGDQGQFEGLVNVDGQSIRSQNADNFLQLVDRAAEGWANSPDDFRRQWEELVRRMQNSINGSFEMDGMERNIRNMDDFFRLNGGFFNNLPGGNFRGSININGEVHEFDSLEEFMKAQSGFFGPVAPQNRNRPNPNENDPKAGEDDNKDSDFDGSLDLNGHKVRFTPPAEFRKRR